MPTFQNVTTATSAVSGTSLILALREAHCPAPTRVLPFGNCPNFEFHQKKPPADRPTPWANSAHSRVRRRATAPPATTRTLCVNLPKFLLGVMMGTPSGSPRRSRISRRPSLRTGPRPSRRSNRRCRPTPQPPTLGPTTSPPHSKVCAVQSTPCR